MKIAVSGSHGFVGQALVSDLKQNHHEVMRLVRSRNTDDGIFWNPVSGEIDTHQLEGLDAVVHLAGENIIGRWTASKKKKIRESRVHGTRSLSAALASLKNPPKTLISASAIGFYGDRGDEILRENSAPGTHFLADVCREWEEATDLAAKRGVRVVCTRFGLVLDPSGGALAKMLPAFRMGLGGPLGTGRQYMSWITREDLLRVLSFVLNRTDISGPVNCVSPQPVTNREWAGTLGDVLGKPARLPMPSLLVKMIFGQMGEELFLASNRVEPAVLQKSGFIFRYPLLKKALSSLLSS